MKIQQKIVVPIAVCFLFLYAGVASTEDTPQAGYYDVYVECMNTGSAHIFCGETTTQAL